jgi:hypothetical protein
MDVAGRTGNDLSALALSTYQAVEMSGTPSYITSLDAYDA